MLGDSLMSNINELIARTEKVEGIEVDDLRSSLKVAYPEYRIAKIEDLGEEWQAHLEKPLDKISNRIRTSEFPFKKKKESPDSAEESPESESPESAEDESSPESSGESSSDGEGPPKEKSENPIKNIEHLVNELLQKVKALEEKAGLIDDIHKTIKPHVEDAGMGLPSPEDLGPTAPGGGNPAGLGPGMPPGGPPGMPGQGMRPQIPRRPNVPSGRPDTRLRNPAQRGMPSGFANTQKIVFVPMTHEGHYFSLDDAATAMQEKYPEYRIASIQEDLDHRRYVGKLKLD